MIFTLSHRRFNINNISYILPRRIVRNNQIDVETDDGIVYINNWSVRENDDHTIDLNYHDENLTIKPEKSLIISSINIIRKLLLMGRTTRP